MPHKHTRRGTNDASQFDLPPSTIARPLTSYNKASLITKRSNSRKRKAVETGAYKHDDTPRAFARMMHLQNSRTRARSGLDDGNEIKKPKKQARASTTSDVSTSTPQMLDTETTTDIPRILPGERLRDFAARVNQALPVGGLARKGTTKIDGLQERQTKTEKRLQKMYAEWRKEDARRKEKLEEQQELEEEAEEERQSAMDGQDTKILEMGGKWKRRKVIGELADLGDDDPWAELKLRRERPKGLHDVVQAPPTLKVVPKEKFKVRHGAKINISDVPSAAGSLKRREELSDARREVIERYRTMMKKGL